MLSPLVMGSPVAESRPFNNFTPLSTPKTVKRFRAESPPPSPVIAKAQGPPPGVFGLGGAAGVNGKGKAPQVDEAEEKEMEEKALAFERKSIVVKECFRRWVQRATDRAAYLEARRHDEEYRAKLHRSANGLELRASRDRHPNGNGLAIDKKRRMSASMNGVGEGKEHRMSPKRKRARKRATGEYQPPRTDAELAKRFKEVQCVPFLAIVLCLFMNLTPNSLPPLFSSSLQFSTRLLHSISSESRRA
jgi:hypothetical protein